MDLKTAQKTVENQLKKQINDYMVIKVSYSLAFILPYEQGVEFIDLLKHAEEVETDYRNQIEKLTSGSLDKIEIAPVTYNKYLQMKMANLMNISVFQLRDMQLDAPNNE